MSDKINRLAAELETIRTEIAALDAVEEPTEEQKARAAELVTEWDAKTAEREAAIERAAKIEAIRTAALDPKNVEPAFAAPAVHVRKDPFDDIDRVRGGYVERNEMRDRAFSAIETLKFRGFSDEHRERATELANDPMIARHILLTGSPQYRDDFERWMSDPLSFRGTAMTLTDANGGYLVPFTLDPTLILTNDGSDNPFRRVSRIESTATDNWNGVTSAGVTAEWLAEATAAAEAGPTTGIVTITPAKAFAEITASYEILQDSNFAQQLPRLLADAKDRLEAAAFATGATAPKGVVTAVTAVTTSRVSPTTGGTFTSASAADVYKVINALPARHRDRSAWLANFTTLNTIRQMDTYGGAQFWANFAGPTLPPTLLGLPTLASSSMTATVTTGSNILLAGDFQEYIIVDRVGMSLSYDPNVRDVTYQRHTGQGQFTAFWRTGADCGDTNAFRVLKL